MSRVDGKVAIVTGAGGGIGRAPKPGLIPKLGQKFSLRISIMMQPVKLHEAL